MPTAINELTITPLEGRTFGATVQLPSGVSDASLLSEKDFAKLKDALHQYLVLVVKDQKHIPPANQHALTVRFDPSCKGNYGHDVDKFRHKDSVLRKDGWSVPSAPQVQILGQGRHENYQGLDHVDLVHPTHKTFHKTLLSDEEMANNYTRFYRWHIDSALHGLNAPKVTSLLGIHVPSSEHEKYTVKYDDGTGDEIPGISQAATAFVSGNDAFEALSPEDKEFVLNHNVVYAPHPYIFIGKARATSNGLTIENEGKEMKLDELPEWEEKHIKVLPMVWKNPGTGKPHFQVHGCCLWRIEDKQGNTVLELEQAREKVHQLMRPGIAPKNVYCHNWTEGDLVLFYNCGVWHSVTGQFKEGEKRIMHQCNVASGEAPEEYRA